MDPRILRKQVTDNAKEIQNYLEDLKNWESDMKRLESELQNKASGDMPAPPVRTKKKRLSEEKNTKQQSMAENSKRISSYDYASWDKFDADKACEELEPQRPEEAEASSEDEELLVRQREEAVYEKNMGNEYVKSQKWKEAIQCYSRAITCYPYDAIFYANRALCYLKTGMLKSAETDCTAALQLDPSYVKAYQRRATSRVGLGQLNEARADLLKVIELEPKNMASKAELMKIEKNLKLLPQPKSTKEEKEKQGEKLVFPSEKKVEKSEATSAGKGNKAREMSKKKTEVAATETGGMTVNSPVSDSVPGKEQEFTTNTNTMLKAGSIEKSIFVQAVHKPPHLRSKKPMKRIEIKEVSSSSLLNTVEKGNDAQYRLTADGNDKANVCSTNLSKEMDNGAKIITTLSSEDVTEIPPVPHNSVQFLTSWKKVKSSVISRFYYLKQIPGEALPKIFGDSLETSTLSEIISILATNFIEKGEKVYGYVHGLSRVQRFSALTLFLSPNDRSGVKKLLKYCEEQGECTPEESAELMVKYEL